jgi:agmatine/peptidylarginine deiminase
MMAKRDNKVMELTFQAFVVNDRDQLCLIAPERFNAAFFQYDQSVKFPEYANQKVRGVFATIQMEEGKIVSIDRITYSLFVFDYEGKVDAEYWARYANFVMSEKGIVTPNIQDSKDEFCWQPTENMEKNVVKALLLQNHRDFIGS